MSFRSVRRWIPLAILVAVAVLSWRTADAVDVDDAATEAVYYEQQLSTPVLSVRRIPETLRAPIIDDNLMPAIEAIAAGSAGNQFCLTVEVEDRILAEISDSVPLVPASNQKILTTYAALKILGPDHTFETTVTREGEIVEGTLEGNLFLVGGGDPFLSTTNWWTQYAESDGRSNTSLEQLADQVAASGITSVTGTLFGDETLFDNLRSGPWPQRLIDQKQSGPLSALSVNEGHVNGWPEEYVSPGQRSVTDDPAHHAVRIFQALLAERGISIASAEVGISPSSAVDVATVSSPSVLELVTHINSYSSNFGAEMVLKHLGIAGSRQGSTQAGARAVFELLEAEGFDMTGVTVLDGSGLADGIDVNEDDVLERDLLTCGLLADILAKAEPDSDFADSLSISGERGSLLKRYLESSAAGLVFAKTGTLNDVTALSGYVESAEESETTLIFSYVVNGEFAGQTTSLKDLQQPFVEALANYPEGPTIDLLRPLDPMSVPVPSPSTGTEPVGDN